MAKLFMIIGVIIFIIGFIMQFIPIGKLPGDFVIKKGSTTFYFPINHPGQSIIISIRDWDMESLILFLKSTGIITASGKVLSTK